MEVIKHMKKLSILFMLVGIGCMTGCNRTPAPAQAAQDTTQEETREEPTPPPVWTPKYEIKVYVNSNIYTWHTERCDFRNDGWIEFQDKDGKWWWVHGGTATIQSLIPDEQ